MKAAREITAPLTHPLDQFRPRKARKRSDGRCEELCDYLRTKVGDLDGSELDNRRAVWSLILRAEAAAPDGDAVEAIKRLVDIATAADNWHSKNVTNYRYLLNHARQIANAHRERKPSAIDKARQVIEANAVHFAQRGDAGTGGWA
jgi:hypothetical protein